MRTTWANSLLAPDVKRVTIFVANNYVKITNDKGFEAKDATDAFLPSVDKTQMTAPTHFTWPLTGSSAGATGPERESAT